MFGGTFDGNGFVIKGLTITKTLHPDRAEDFLIGTDMVGLFGIIETRATIKNLGIVEARVIGKDFVGVLAGLNNGKIDSCYTTGFVKGYRYVGGLAGRNEKGSIANCYSAAVVNGIFYLGGLVGDNIEACVTNSYSVGKVVGKYRAETGNSYTGNVGALSGRNFQGTIKTCFWDTQSSGLLKSQGGKSLPTAKMKDIKTYLNAGWDFVGEKKNGKRDIWTMEQGDYPRLSWQTK